VDSGQTSENKSFLYKTQHSVIVVPKELTQFNSLPQFPRFPLGSPRNMTPILATKKKNGLHFLTQGSFMEAPAKTESNGFQTFISHL